MPKTTQADSTFEALLEDVTPELSKIASCLRDIILDIHPETVEVIYLGYNSASYGLGPKKNSEAYCYIMPQKAQVNLGFYYGVDLDNPDGLLEGTGKKLRHVKLHSLEEAKSGTIRQLVQASVLERKNRISQ